VTSTKLLTLNCLSVQTGHQNNITKTAQPEIQKYPTSHFSPFNCCLFCSLKKGLTPKMCMLFCHNKYLFVVVVVVVVVFLFFNLLCVWSCFRTLAGIRVLRFVSTNTVHEIS